MIRSFAFVSLALSLAACVREPLPEICPNVEPGTLVIAELRGEQAEQDSFGHWIEIHNAGASTVDLIGARVRFRFASGEVVEFLIRESVEVPAGGEVALGPGLPEEPETWLAYAIGWDISGGDPDSDPPSYPRELLRESSGFVELEGCDQDLLDEVFFAELPTIGTLACGNAELPPDAADNDDTRTPGCWCIDAGEADPGQPIFGIGTPGTPGRPNRCP
ncbi:hypothetical protein ACNOYE_02320 [Nannocystaceae bacterium ST9]